MLAHLMARMARTAPVSRRGFLLGAAAASGGLAVGFRPGALRAEAAGGTAGDTAINPLEAYIVITPEDRVIIRSSQFEMGQGSYHGLATLVVEELGARWDQVEVVGAANNIPAYGNIAWGGAAQGSGGSTSMVTSWERYRMAGATAREMLVAAAAEEWGVPAEEITVEDGAVHHAGNGALAFGALAARAAAMPLPEVPILKAPSEWREIGREDLRRHDTAPKTDGTATFTIDLKLPGLLTAVPIHPPKFGARLAGFDAEAAKAVPGVVDVVQTPFGLAVVGEHMWAALKGREAVSADWDESGAETRGSAEIMAEYRALAEGEPAGLALDDGDAAAALGEAATVVEATYEFPFLAHAALEPLNAVAAMAEDGTLEVWGGHQMPDLYQWLASETAGVPPERVRLHVMRTGGGFGRRAVGDGDVIVEAVAVARALDWRAPVRMQWTREDDMRGGRYRPAYVHRIEAGLTADGAVSGWRHHIVGQSIMAGGPMAAFVQDGIDPTSVEGAAHLPYALGPREVGLTTVELGVPVLWWRAVGSTHTAYAVETFLDELAAAAERDPLEFRLALLEDSPRHAAVLRLAAEKAGWGEAPAEGRFRGIALAESFSTPVAQVVELSLEGGRPRVHRVVAAVDCGVAINPDNVRAQVEGGIGFGLGAILEEELTLTGGAVDQGNYDGYTPLRIDAMPQVEVHIVPSEAPPTGIGEPGVPPIGPAVANALRAATGRTIRTLPITRALEA